jgi:hypothetical protein
MLYLCRLCVGFTRVSLVCYFGVRTCDEGSDGGGDERGGMATPSGAAETTEGGGDGQEGARDGDPHQSPYLVQIVS